jgi:membrane-bound lytic murein transglycosylase A
MVYRAFVVDSRLILRCAMLALSAIAVATCAPSPPQKLILQPAAFSDLDGWTAETHADALPALAKSCGRLKSLPAGRSLGAGELTGSVGEWRALCAAAAGTPTDDAAARRYFETWFKPYLATDNGNPDGLFTGYYEAELRGAWTRKGRYQVPIYRPPDDLITVDLGLFREEWKGQRLTGRQVDGRLVPYPARSEIDAGALAGKGSELLWVDDAIDAFFLHVQGSGRVVMENGQLVRLGFAGRNGHSYVAIGRELISRGAIPRERMSMQAIRAWLKTNPGEAAEVMALNPSFIFFGVIDGEGPIGAEGVPLTPGRSLAVDPTFVPLGLPIWLDTTEPLSPKQPLRRLVVAQDTGSAIKGPVRGDLFWGFGETAATKAGAMKQQGRYFLLLPRKVPVP